MPDADVIPFESPKEPGKGALGPSKAARLVGNTGPQPVAPKPAEPAVPVKKKVKRPVTPADASSDALTNAPTHAPGEPAVPAPTSVMDVVTTEEVEGWIDFARRRMRGDYSVDDFGFDPELTDRVLMAMARPLYEKWFRVEATGLDNVPDDTAALVVANHSGTIAVDSVMTQVALHDEHPAHRHLRMLGANLVFQTPFLGELARKAGHTLACHPDAERLLSEGEVVGVWPEGFKGIGKPFNQRYKLQRFGRGGFVAAAIRTGAPIIPTAIVGAEEIYPMIYNSGTIARILGLPYFPITPTFPWLGPLGLVPLPSKWLIHFGDPIPTDAFPPGAADDPMVVFDLTDQVRERIQQSLYRLLVKRPSAFG